MLGKLNLRLSQPSSLVKTLEVNVPTSYSQNRSMKIGFAATTGRSSSMFDFRSSLIGRASAVSLAQGEKIAQLISEQFSLPVTVIKELKDSSDKVGSAEQSVEKDNLGTAGSLPTEEAWVSAALQVDDVSHCRDIIKFLEEQKYIVEQEPGIVDHFISDVEAELALAATLTPEINQKQKAILWAYCEKHVNTIIDACMNETPTRDAIMGNVTELEFDVPDSKRELAFACLLQSTQQDAASLFLNQFNGLSEYCMQSAKALHLIFSGDSRLESKFTSEGAGIPFLTQQRLALLELIEKKLTEQFGSEDGPKSKSTHVTTEYLQALRTRLFSEGYQLDVVEISQEHDDAPKVLKLQPFEAVFDALQGNFGSTVIYGGTFSKYIPKHRWRAPNGETLEGEAARDRFLQIKAEVDAQSS